MQTQLVKKSVSFSPQQIAQLKRRAHQKKMSFAGIVRYSIDIGNGNQPQSSEDTQKSSSIKEFDLMELASKKLKEAITNTQKTNLHIANTIKQLS